MFVFFFFSPPPYKCLIKNLKKYTKNNYNNVFFFIYEMNVTEWICQTLIQIFSSLLEFGLTFYDLQFLSNFKNEIQILQVLLRLQSIYPPVFLREIEQKSLLLSNGLPCITKADICNTCQYSKYAKFLIISGNCYMIV